MQTLQIPIARQLCVLEAYQITKGLSPLFQTLTPKKFDVLEAAQIIQGFWQLLQTKELQRTSTRTFDVDVLEVKLPKDSGNFTKLNNSKGLTPVSFDCVEGSSKHSMLDRLMCWRFIMSLIQLDVLEVRQVARRFWQPLHTVQCVGGSSSCQGILAISPNICTQTTRTQTAQCVGGSSSSQPTVKHHFNTRGSTTSYYKKFLANFDKKHSRQKPILCASAAL